ncbi:uncharacterized protein EHS24_005665 [Apiotrichum porosum]|uniref:Aquaporin n=1 Tax=Apiotrichum porosum TaxID=105984 RepID=A0A427XZ92_9TREE|nr:uncharacterized protein EHS24_005665 [Apiotrichum porosum]RSH84160.1 hypothetical protein EHS24_005665 [Apiotrichum porosum]
MSKFDAAPEHADLNASTSTSNEKAPQAKVNHLAPGSLVAKNHGIAMLGEFVGTTLFLLFSLGGTSVALQASNSVTGDVKDGSSTANTSNLLFIGLMFGLSLTANIWCFFRISGGLFNPAVTFAFVLIGGITPVRGALLFITQLAGGLAGAALADGLTPGPLYAATTLGGGASVARGFWIEVFMTIMLVFTILIVAAEKHRGTFMAPLAIGISFTICEMFSVYYTGGSLNPARSLGPAVMNKSFPSYHWIYWIGPLLGAFFAAALYKVFKYLNYQTNLGPDCDGDGVTFDHNNDVRARLDRIETLILRNNNISQV